MTRSILRSVLAATDLTAASDEVLRAAAELARRTGARLHVLHAMEFPPPPYVQQYAEAVSFPARVEAAERALDEQLARTLPEGVEAATRRVEIYAAHRAIAAYAEAVSADVVVLGPHARRALDPGFLGTTADRVIRTVEVPCLIVRGTFRLPLQQVVVPIDLSERSGGVLDAAFRWGKALGEHDGALPLPETELDILHVVPRLFAPAGLPFQRATILPGMNREVEAALERAGGAASLDVREEVLWGEKADAEIVRFARDAAADLVILATHGHGPVKRALIGGVAAGVVRAAPCPVLLLPPGTLRHDPEGAGVARMEAVGSA